MKIIRHFTALFSVFCMLAVFAPGQAQAQQCIPTYEIIVRLDSPPLGSYSVMNASYGQKTPKEEFFGAARSPDSDNRHIVLMGERRAFEGASPSLILVAMDRRGRIVWEQDHAIEGLGNVVKILPHKNGHTVLANIAADLRAANKIWIGFFNTEGVLQKTAEIADPKFDIAVHDGFFHAKTRQYILATSAKSRGASGDVNNAIVYRLDEDAKVVSQNGYAPGLENRILSLQPTEAGSIVATGYIRTADGRKAGWAMMLEESGALMWQRQYPRGLMASLNAGAAFIDNHIIVAGEAHPAGNGRRAAWVMALNDSDGAITWQRYYRGELAFKTQALITHPDGLISVLVDGLTEKGDEVLPHVRLLTLTPRGTFFSNDTFLNGKGTWGYALIEGMNKERVIVGSSEIYHRPDHYIDGDAVEDEDYSRDGWVLWAASTDPYDDPCKQPFRLFE